MMRVLIFAVTMALLFSAPPRVCRVAAEDSPAVVDASEASEAAADSAGMRLMSVNIRNGLAKDGLDHWDVRRPRLVKVLRAADADIIGTQETYPFQAEYLREQFPEYEYIGRSRDDQDGEQCGILVRRSRFGVIEQGHFWLSETPDTPASKSWDAALPRMATWIRLLDKPHDRRFVLLNTHFDHRGEQSRINSAKLLRNYVQRFAVASPTVVMGDFNAAADSEPHQTLLSDQGGVRLLDTYRQVFPERQADEGTFNGFQGRTAGPRIDWVLVSPDIQVLGASIVRAQDEGRWPSDHFPVTADVTFK